MTVLAWEADPFDVRRVADAAGLLRVFNDAGVLLAGEVHVAARIGALVGETDDAVLLAAALAVRAPRLGHVFVDLAAAATTTTVELDEPIDLSALPWPAGEDWVARVAASPLVAVGEEDRALRRPLRLVGTHVYLDRYWREEIRLAEDLRTFAEPAGDVDEAALGEGLVRLFPDAEPHDRQRLAAATAVLRRLSVVAGGPGTGKTTTVGRIVALLVEQAAARGEPTPLVALAAPTGKAAARLEEAIHEQAQDPRLTVDDATRATLRELSASTLHRLLGWRPDSRSRFRHHRENRLPHDVVIVDETSMVSLSLMARLVEAVRPDARLVLVGDPGQLTSIEAGAVLGDVVGPSRDALVLSDGARAMLEAAAGADLAAEVVPSAPSVNDGVVLLQRVHRYRGAIAELAEAIDRADADGAIGVLEGGHDDVLWLRDDPADVAGAALAPIREAAVAAARAVVEAAVAGDGLGALHELGAFRLLCAHRRGLYGAAHWMRTIERWLTERIEGFRTDGEWYVGRPLLVTENDYGLRLYNGDTGVVVAVGEDRVAAAFERRGGLEEFSPTRLSAVDTVYAMTIHKSQGSQFGTAAVVLPPPRSPILTRELLYTGVTRAQARLIVAGTEETIREAIARPAARASGLGARLR